MTFSLAQIDVSNEIWLGGNWPIRFDNSSNWFSLIAILSLLVDNWDAKNDPRRVF